MTIKDTEYRYLVVRKLLKKLRKEVEPKSKKGKKNVTGSKLAHSALCSESESETSALSVGEAEREVVPRKRLGQQVM
jgi:hypothetical protein